MLAVVAVLTFYGRELIATVLTFWSLFLYVPARVLEDSMPQMRKKGRIQVGMDADIIALDPATVTDRTTFEKPAATSIGMRYVVVNGVVVIDQGTLVRRALPGQAIRREQEPPR